MKKLTQEELNVILDKHQKWLNDEPGGERANLQDTNLQDVNLRTVNLRDADLRNVNLCNANLQYANLQCANLWNANLQCANLCNANLRYADLQDVNLRYASLWYADLRNAKLQNADLWYAELDFSCLPLWCGSLSAHFDDRTLTQIAYHLVKAGLQSKNASEKTKAELSKLIDFANEFHRANECGRIEKE